MDKIAQLEMKVKALEDTVLAISETYDQHVDAHHTDNPLPPDALEILERFERAVRADEMRGSLDPVESRYVHRHYLLRSHQIKAFMGIKMEELKSIMPDLIK